MGDKPEFRVGVAGLDPRDLRLIEIVFRHSQYNKYAYRLVEPARGFEILIANAQSPAGERTIGAMRARGERRPVISVLGRGEVAGGERAIAIDRLTLQLLPILNRVVELEFASGEREAPPAAQESARADAGRAEMAPAAEQSRAQPIDGSQGDRAAQDDGPGDVPLERAAGVEAESATEHETRPELEAEPATEHDTRPELEAGFVPRPLAVPEPASAEEPPTAAEPVAAADPVSATRPIPAPEPIPGPEPELADQLEPAPATDGPPRMGFEPAPAAEPEAKLEAEAEGKLESEPEIEPEIEAGLEPELESAPEIDDDDLRAADPAKLVRFPGGAGPASPGADRRLRVLVVDDSPTVRRQLMVALDRLGLACETVESAARALERLAERHFDLALVDVVMPDADGYKLTRDIKRDKRLRQMPVIILTSRSSPFDLARGALSGCDAYLSKPVPFRALEAAVVKQLRRSLAIDDLAALTQGVQTGDPDDQPRAESRLARLFRR